MDLFTSGVRSYGKTNTKRLAYYFIQIKVRKNSSRLKYLINRNNLNIATPSNKKIPVKPLSDAAMQQPQEIPPASIKAINKNTYKRY